MAFTGFLKQRQTNVALVGYGYAAKVFHAPLISSTPGLKLQTVVSSDPAKVRRDLPDTSIVKDVGTAFGDPQIGLVVIAAPNRFHAELAHAAIAAGKHVVVDKPFALTVGEAEKVLTHSERAGVLLSVFHNRRWDSDFMTLQKLVRQGAFGEVVQYESHFDRHRPSVRDRWRERAGLGSGAWFDLGPHLVDQTLQLFGMPETVSADIAAQRNGAETDDYFHVVLRYRKLRVILHSSSLGPGRNLRMCVHGTKASFVKSGFDQQETALKANVKPGGPGWGEDPEPGILTVDSDGTSIANDVAGESGNYGHYYSAMRDAITSGTPVPVLPGDALATTVVIERAFESAKKGCEIRTKYDALKDTEERRSTEPLANS